MTCREAGRLVYAPDAFVYTHPPTRRVGLVQPWLKGYKQNALTLQQWRYYDVEARR
jgi:hypothetical protein